MLPEEFDFAGGQPDLLVVFVEDVVAVAVQQEPFAVDVVHV